MAAAVAAAAAARARVWTQSVAQGYQGKSFEQLRAEDYAKNGSVGVGRSVGRSARVAKRRAAVATARRLSAARRSAAGSLAAPAPRHRRSARARHRSEDEMFAVVKTGKRKGDDVVGRRRGAAERRARSQIVEAQDHESDIRAGSVSVGRAGGGRRAGGAQQPLIGSRRSLIARAWRRRCDAAVIGSVGAQPSFTRKPPKFERFIRVRRFVDMHWRFVIVV